MFLDFCDFCVVQVWIYDMRLEHGIDLAVHHPITRHSHRIFWNGLIVVEDQNVLSTTNRKPPNNLFNKFPIR